MHYLVSWKPGLENVWVFAGFPRVQSFNSVKVNNSNKVESELEVILLVKFELVKVKVTLNELILKSWKLGNGNERNKVKQEQ